MSGCGLSHGAGGLRRAGTGRFFDVFGASKMKGDESQIQFLVTVCRQKEVSADSVVLKFEGCSVTLHQYMHVWIKYVSRKRDYIRECTVEVLARLSSTLVSIHRQPVDKAHESYTRVCETVCA